MRLGIVACEILKKEIELLTRDDPDFIERIYLEFALHLDPPVMRKRIIARASLLHPSSFIAVFSAPRRIFAHREQGFSS